MGAARDLEALQTLGVTHVLNASPIVPCFHRRKLRYKNLLVYDDEQEDIAQFFEAANAFIAKVCCMLRTECTGLLEHWINTDDVLECKCFMGGARATCAGWWLLCTC